MDASSYSLATALSTAAGIRPFLTIAIAAWMMYGGQLHPSEQFQWLGSFGVASVLSLLAAVEFAADKVPLLDHAMHVVHFAIKPIAAALIVGGTIPASDPQMLTFVTMGVGALNAFGIHTALVGARAASTTFSFGLANPVVSVMEDIFAVVGIGIAFIFPFLGLAISIAVIIVIIRLTRSVHAMVRKQDRPISTAAITKYCSQCGALIEYKGCANCGQGVKNAITA